MSVDRERMTVFRPGGEEHEYLGTAAKGIDALCGVTVHGGRISRGKVTCKGCRKRRAALEMTAIDAASAAKRGGETHGPGVVIDLAEERRRRSKGAA